MLRDASLHHLIVERKTYKRLHETMTHLVLVPNNSNKDFNGPKKHLCCSNSKIIQLSNYPYRKLQHRLTQNIAVLNVPLKHSTI